jgi:thiamine biosynthesis lipoprotein
MMLHRAFLFSAIVALCATACNHSRPPISRQSTAMNTYIAVTIYDDVSESLGQALIDTAFAEIRRVEGFATDYSDTSEVGRINLAAGKDSVAVSRELVDRIHEGIAFGDLSEGKLDITIGRLVKVWNFIGEHPHVPARAVVDSFLPFIDYKKIVIHGTSVFLPSPMMRLDLGSIGKGYAIRRAAQKLKDAGLHRFIVDIGGKLSVNFPDTYLLDSTAAEILVRHPRRDGEYFGRFRVGSGAVSTSGDYQRYFIEDGIRYHHLLDPDTGYPVRGLVAVTVVCDDPLDADAYSTIAFLLGKEKGMEFIRHTPKLEGMIIYEEGDSLRYEMTDGLAKVFHRD